MARVYAALATVYLVWGSTYLGIAVPNRTRAPLPSDALLSAGMQMLAAGVLLAVAGGFAGEAAQVRVPSAASLGALAYLVVVGSIIAFTAYGWLLQNASATLVSTYAYVNP